MMDCSRLLTNQGRNCQHLTTPYCAYRSQMADIWCP